MKGWLLGLNLTYPARRGLRRQGLPWTVSGRENNEAAKTFSLPEQALTASSIIIHQVA